MKQHAATSTRNILLPALVLLLSVWLSGCETWQPNALASIAVGGVGSATESGAGKITPGYPAAASANHGPVSAFWQSWWFGLSCVLAVALGAWLLYRIRMHQKIAQLNLRFEERLAERTRIAQELHDTLLQGVLSAKMHLHVAGERLADDSAAKPVLIRAQQLMDEVIRDGRNALQGLRSPGGDLHKLEQAFSRIPQELVTRQEIAYRVIVEGSPRPLHPLIRDEVYRIGREALVNAFRHGNAESIEIQVAYAAAHLRITVRDDGCGIEPLVLQSGREGHWGLAGMRERAERIGARLRLWSRSHAGTEIELTVPRDVAYQPQPGNGRTRWIGQLQHRAKSFL